MRWQAEKAERCLIHRTKFDEATANRTMPPQRNVRTQTNLTAVGRQTAFLSLTGVADESQSLEVVLSELDPTVERGAFQQPINHRAVMSN